MYSTNFIIDCVLENDILTEDWFEFALVLEEAGELAGAELALLEAIEYESWKLLWQERLLEQETTEMLDAEMLRFLWLHLPDAVEDEEDEEPKAFGTGYGWYEPMHGYGWYDSEDWYDLQYEQYENRVLRRLTQP